MRKVRIDDFDDFKRRYDAGAETSVRICDHPDCREEATHRAPRSPRELDRFYWFCMPHVQEYNKAWNFYRDMTQEEVEAMTDKDIIGWRPTWPFGKRGAKVHDRHTRPFDTMSDEFGFFREGPTGERARQRSHHEETRLTGAEKALATLGLDDDIDLAALKVRYKALVKRFHPDANGGDTKAEERLKEINEAYHMLRKRLAS